MNSCPPPHLLSLSSSALYFMGSYKPAGKKRTQEFKDLRLHLGIDLGTSHTENQAQTDCANPSSIHTSFL